MEGAEKLTCSAESPLILNDHSSSPPESVTVWEPTLIVCGTAAVMLVANRVVAPAAFSWLLM